MSKRILDTKDFSDQPILFRYLIAVNEWLAIWMLSDRLHVWLLIQSWLTVSPHMRPSTLYIFANRLVHLYHFDDF